MRNFVHKRLSQSHHELLMNRRAQQSVLFIIMEIALLIGATVGIFTLIDRAASSYTPAQGYLAKELAFTKDALDIYAGASVYYQFSSLAAIHAIGNEPFVLGFANQRAVAGTESAPYHPDTNMKESIQPQSIPLLALEIAGGRFYADGLYEKRHLLDTPCGSVTMPATIALFPTTADSFVIAALLAGQNKRFVPEAGRLAEMTSSPAFMQQKFAEADAVLFIETVQVPTYKAYASDRLLGCTFLNAVTPEVASSDALPSFALLPLTFSKPAVRLVIGVPQGTEEQRITFLKSVADKLSGVVQ